MAEESGIGVGAPDASIIFGVDIKGPLEGFSILEKKMADFRSQGPVGIRFGADIAGLKTQLGEAQSLLNASSLTAPVRLNLVEGSITAIRAEVAAAFAASPITVPLVVQTVHGGGSSSIASSMVNPANSPSATQMAMQARNREAKALQAVLNSLPADMDSRRAQMGRFLSNLSGGTDEILGPTLMARGGRRPGAGRPREIQGPPNPFQYPVPAGPPSPFQYSSPIGPVQYTNSARINTVAEANARRSNIRAGMADLQRAAAFNLNLANQPLQGPSPVIPRRVPLDSGSYSVPLGPIHGPWPNISGGPNMGNYGAGYGWQGNLQNPHLQMRIPGGNPNGGRGPFSSPGSIQAPFGYNSNPSILSRAGSFINSIGSPPSPEHQRAMAKMQEQARRDFFAGNTLIRGFTLPALAVAGGTGLMSARLQTQMGHIQGLTEQSRPMTNWMQRQIINQTLGDNIGAEDRASAGYEISSTGFKGGDAMKILEVSSKGAAAGMGEVKDIASLNTTILSAYSQTAEKAAHNQDVLTQMVIYGKGEASQYANALGKVIPMASMLGVSLEELGASLATMSRVGINPGEGATALNQLITHIAAPTKQAKKELKELGYTPAALRTMVHNDGLNSTLGQVYQSATKGGQSGIDTFETLFGNVRGLKAFLSTTATQADVYKEALSQMKNAAGSTDKALSAVADSAEMQFGRALNAIKRTAYAIGDTVLPWLTKKFEGFADTAPKAFDRIGNSWEDLGQVPGGKAAQAGVGLASAGLLLSGPLLNMAALAKDARSSQVFSKVIGAGASPMNRMGVIGAGLIGARYLDSNFGLLGGVTDGPASLLDSDAGNMAMLGGMAAWTGAKYGPGAAKGLSTASAGVATWYQRQALMARMSPAMARGLGMSPYVAGRASSGLLGGISAGMAGISTGGLIAGGAVAAGALLIGGGIATYAQSRDRALTGQSIRAMNLKGDEIDIMKSLDKASSTASTGGNLKLTDQVDALREKIVGANGDTIQLGSALRDIDKIALDVKSGKIKLDPLSRKLFLSDFEALKHQTGKLTVDVAFKYKNSYEAFKEDISAGFKGIAQDFLDYTAQGNAIKGRIASEDRAATDYTKGSPGFVLGGKGTTSPFVAGLKGLPGTTAPKAKLMSPFMQSLDLSGMPSDPIAALFTKLTGLGASNGEDVISRIEGWDTADPKARAALNRANAMLKKNPDLVTKAGTPLAKALRTRLIDFNTNRPYSEKEEPEDDNSANQGIANGLREQVERLQTQKEALSETKNAWDSFGSAIEGTVGKLSSFSDKSQQAAMQTAMMKRNVDGVTESSKKQIVELASYIDRLGNLKTGQGALKGLVGGMESSLVNVGANPGLLSGMMKDLNNMLPFKGDIKGLQSEALIKGRELANAAQSESDRLEQTMKDLTAQIKSLNDTISGLESKTQGSTTAANISGGSTGGANTGQGSALFKAIVGNESGGDHTIMNHAGSGATGLGQVMPENIGPWTHAALGKAMTQNEFRYNRAAQVKTISHQLGLYYQEELKNTNGDEDLAVRRVASKWYSGKAYKLDDTKKRVTNGVTHPTIKAYTLDILKRYKDAGGGAAGLAEAAKASPNIPIGPPVLAPADPSKMDSVPLPATSAAARAANSLKSFKSGRGKNFYSSQKIHNRNGDYEFKNEPLAFSGADMQLSQFNTKWLNMLPKGFAQPLNGKWDPNRPAAKELQMMLMNVKTQEDMSKGLAELSMKDFKGSPKERIEEFANRFAAFMSGKPEIVKPYLGKIAGGAFTTDKTITKSVADNYMEGALFSSKGELFASGNPDDPMARSRYDIYDQPNSPLSMSQKNLLYSLSSSAMKNRQQTQLGLDFGEGFANNTAAGIGYSGIMSTGSSMGGSRQSQEFLARYSNENKYRDQKWRMSPTEFKSLIDQKAEQDMIASDIKRESDNAVNQINRKLQNNYDMFDAGRERSGVVNRRSSGFMAIQSAGDNAYRDAFRSSYDYAIAGGHNKEDSRTYAETEANKQKSMRMSIESFRQDTEKLKIVDQSRVSMEDSIIARNEEIMSTLALTKEQKVAVAVIKATSKALRQGIGPGENLEKIRENAAREELARIKQEKELWSAQQKVGAVGAVTGAVDSGIDALLAGSDPQKEITARQQKYQWLSMRMDLKDAGFGPDSREYRMADRQFKRLKEQEPDDSPLGKVKAAFGETLGNNVRKLGSDSLKKVSGDIITPWLGKILGIKTPDTSVEGTPGMQTQIANITAETVNLTGANVYVNQGAAPGQTGSVSNGSGRPGAMTTQQAGLQMLTPFINSILGGRS